MKKMIKCVVVCNLLLGVFPFFVLAADKKIELYDNNGNYSYGKVKENGNVEIYDNNTGKYTYGKTK